MRKIWENIKENFISVIILLLIGFYWGQIYAQLGIGTDCKVLGMFRIGQYGYGCQASKVPA